MKIIPFKSPTSREIDEAADTLKNGGLVGLPTETCYGMGVDATNAAAVARLLKFKGGRENKAISIAVADKTMAERYVDLTETAENLYQTLLPGPVTVISQSQGHVVKALESEDGTLGIRIPNYPAVLELIKKLGKPITATSANTSGKKPPYSLAEWQRYTSIKKQQLVALWLDAGRLAHQLPSTLVDTRLNDLTVLRQGEVEIPKASYQFGSFTEAETQRLGEQIMSSYRHELAFRPVIIALQGELGTGKTQMAKGVARALGIKTTIPSPTYTIVREYPHKKRQLQGRMYHIDTWRLPDTEELWTLGLESMMQPGNVIVIEWVQKMSQLVKKLKHRARVIWVDIQTKTPQTRTIRWWTNN
ncbi:hypothetical protein A2W24_00190 [Microgenomates group bacterium RBG_16_45_19]|nr:MAG: hypothetical protein A2W24_00190 [Microgenomates group bacterium RBG_16_45_19]